ncbi:MAG: heavy metal translocating P-type ATPase [Clostridia bacterium]|nr:heavy metal translocating P-type ATPase [Clostridia bacterium]
MQKYSVKGMSCAACSARVEKAVRAVEGVESCSVNLLTNSMVVEGNVGEDSVIAAVTAAGYGAEKFGKKAEQTKNEMPFENEPAVLKKRLFWSLGCLAVLMYVSMGAVMWGWPLPEFLSGNHIAIGLVQLLLTIAIMVINRKFFTSGFKALIKLSPNMDTLVALGAGAAFGYSVYVLFAMTCAVGDAVAMHNYLHQFYFESAAMILTLITVGKLLEARSKGKTADALRGLMDLAPKSATVLRDGKEILIPAEELVVGDVFIVKAGESIPADGIVVEGDASVDESRITGESIPVDKLVGDNVTGATINSRGFLKCRALRVAEDTTLSQIIRMVSDATSMKAPVSKAADKVSGVFVPVVLGVAAVTFAIWILSGADFGFAIARGISVLVISCPCALGLATPVAIMVGSGVGAKGGILFKTAVSLEELGKIKTVALDKTGTVTKGEPKVTDIICLEGYDETEFLMLSASAEKKSEHPLAKTIAQKAEEMGIETKETEKFEALLGNGVVAEISGDKIIGGSLRFIKSVTEVDDKTEEITMRLSSEGKTPLLFCKNNIIIGIIAVADAVKEDSKVAIAELKRLGLEVVMITGDNERTAQAIARETGIENVIAGVLPNGKSHEISKLKEKGKVAMVGDGINDAPALATADIGVAIGAGSDIAIDAADVVLMKSSIRDVAAAVRLSRATLKNVYENLFWAFIYNIVGIPLAAGAFISFLGWEMNPMFGAAAMSLSSFCVVSNALRLNLVKIYGREKKIKERKTMTKVIKIEGMMCPHCEANVKTTLEGLQGVASAEVSHKTGMAKLILSEDIENSILKNAVEEKGYKVISVE